MSPTVPTAEQLRGLFAETFHIEPPAADTDLLDSGILDSMQLAELLVQLEQHYGAAVRLDAIELDDLRTLQRIAALLAASVAGSAA